MSREYTQKTASLQAVTVDTHILDANKILVYPGEGDRTSRIDVADSLKLVSTLDSAVFGNEIARTYDSVNIPINHTLDGANITAIRLSRKHCISGKINSIKIPFEGATSTVTGYLSVQVFVDNNNFSIVYSENTQTQTSGTSGESVFNFTDFTLPNDYKFIQLCFVPNKTSVPNVSNNTGNTGFRVRIVKNSDASNQLEWDDDDCGLYSNLTYKNWIARVVIDYTAGEGLVGQVSDITDSINEIHELLENVGPSDDCALKSADNTFTGTNTFSSDSTINVKGPLYVDAHPDAKPNELGFNGTTGLAITRDGIKTRMPVTIVAEGGERDHIAPTLNVLPLGKKTALGADAYAIQASLNGGLQLWGTHFMQGDEWSSKALKVVHNELALFGNHQAPCSLTFDNANVVNFRVMPDDGSTANEGQGAIFDFSAWQWDNDDHTAKNANCPVQLLKNNAGSLTERSILNKAELDENYIIANEDNKHIVDTLNETIDTASEYATGWIKLETNTISWSFWIDNYGPYQITKDAPLAQDWCNLINAQDIPYEAVPHETNNAIFYIKSKNPGSGYCVPFGLGPEIGKRAESQVVYSGLTLSCESISLKKIDFLSDAQTRFAQRSTDNTFGGANTFEQTVTAKEDIIVTNGIITFEDLIDGTVIERSGASGYRYVEGIPASFNNGVCYDIGEISNTTNLSNVTFSAEGRLVQTCELWFTTPATVPTTHQWPANIYWIDSANGAAPTLIASKNYRLVFRQEPNKIIASIAYMY